MTHGYARCSTNESRQDIDRQVRELKLHGAENIWLEYEHGDAAVKREQETMFEAAQPGDTIITLEVARLARSTRQLCEIVDIIREKRLRLVIVNSITMDCRNGQPDPMTEAFLLMAGVFAQLELQIIRQRVRSGMANAREKGKRIGRPRLEFQQIPDRFLRYYALYQTQGLTVAELARLAQVSRPTVYKYLALMEKKGKRGDGTSTVQSGQAGGTGYTVP